MKRVKSFDARCLRMHNQPRWYWRLALLLAVLAACLGALLLVAGAVGLLGQPVAVLPAGESQPLLLAGGLLLICALLAWRACRARVRRRSDLSLARHLLKKQR